MGGVSCRGLAGGGLIALACTLGPSAQAQSLGPLVQITAGDPFSRCTADRLTSQEAAYGSILYPNTAIEPWVAIDPTDRTRLLVGHQQDRWDDGGSRGLVGNLSTDGGGTWSNTIPGGVSECTGGKFPRASDPWVTFSPHGTAFFFSLTLFPAQATTPFGSRRSGMLVSRSTDHAKTWSDPTTLIANNTPHVLNDKNSITADPKSPGFVYAVWDQLSVFPSPGDTSADALLASNDGVVIAHDLLRTAAAGGAPFFKFAFTGPTFFSQTQDDGATWSEPAAIYQPGTNAQTINNIVQVLPKGDVLDFFTNLDFSVSVPTQKIGYVRSTDKGLSWSGPTFVTDIQVVGVVTPDSQQPVRDASILYSVAVDPASGALYLSWQDDRFSTGTCTTPTGSIPIDGIVFTQSLDGGKNWSPPVKINQTPTNTNPCREQAFIPAVVAAGDGTVVVTYYDFRNKVATPGFEATDYFAVFCFAGIPGVDCSQPANWGNEQRLTPTSFNILNAPIARGHFLGDYMGLAASGQSVLPVFGIATGPNLTADFTRLIIVP